MSTSRSGLGFSFLSRTHALKRPHVVFFSFCIRSFCFFPLSYSSARDFLLNLPFFSYLNFSSFSDFFSSAITISFCQPFCPYANLSTCTMSEYICDHSLSSVSLTSKETLPYSKRSYLKKKKKKERKGWLRRYHSGPSHLSLISLLINWSAPLLLALPFSPPLPIFKETTRMGEQLKAASKQSKPTCFDRLWSSPLCSHSKISQ